MRNLPNALTLLNLVCGFAGIVLLFNGRPDLVLYCAALALLADVADGMVARSLNVSSELGIQLDSLADLVSFGVLPGCIMFDLWSNGCGNGFTWYGLIATAALPAAAGLRLARFNIDTRDRKTFYGLPAPAAGIAVFGLLYMYLYEDPMFNGMVCGSTFLLAISVALGIALLSSLRLWSLKGLGEPRGRWILAGLILAFAVLIYIFQGAGIPLFIVAYLIFGMINQFLKVY